MSFEPTLEQKLIVEAAKSSDKSILISALAGAAKTSTLELVAQAMPSIPTLSLAFNKRIAEEMARRLPSHVSARTMNSVGHHVWSQTIGKKQLMVDTKKSYTLLKEEVEGLRGSEKREAYEVFGDLLRMIGAAKLNGYLPGGRYGHIDALIDPDTFFLSFEEEPYDWMIAMLDRVLIRSIKASYDGLIDFDDQVYMPTLFGGTFPKFPLVLIDEAQDLSPLNHAMLDKLVVKRLIAVGDERQSIYAFRGADVYSMPRLRERFHMEHMKLSTSFRCPRSVVRFVRKHAPHMQWPDWAIEGEVVTLTGWEASAIPDSAAIICRNNAPLFKCALSLIKAGRGVRLVGTDLGPQLIKTLKKLGDESMSQKQTLNAIEEWERERLKKSRSKAATTDKAECLKVFASFGETLGAAIAYAEHLFATSGPIQLLSGHKAKGLEWDIVYFLDPWRVPLPWATTKEELSQEDNISYVICTRAKKALYLVDLEGLRV